VLDAAGGLDRFNKIQSIEAVADLSGSFWAKKGYPNRTLCTGYVDTKQPRIVLHNIGAHLDEPHLRWIWTPKYLSVERPDGAVVLSRKDPFKHFEGHVIDTPWDDLDLLYFRGYALWNYIMTPFYFTWPGFSTRELEPHKENGQTWRVLKVTYPEDLPTHCQVQKFYYDERFILRRLDYTVDVITDSGHVAHYVYDDRKVDGIVFPTLRRALNIVNDHPSGWSTVLINFHKITVRRADPRSSL
jgi:hypothetical protein